MKNYFKLIITLPLVWVIYLIILFLQWFDDDQAFDIMNSLPDW